MKTLTASALVAYSAEQMFDLVNDVASYPQFMPGCVGSTIVNKGDDWLEAELNLSQAGVQQRFTTRNHLNRPSSIDMTLVDGPFSKLEGHWRFHPLSAQACKLEFELGFIMKNRLLEMTLSGLFASITQQQVAAVCQRAKVLYSPA